MKKPLKLKVGDTVKCIKRRRLKGDLRNYSIEELKAGEKYTIESINGAEYQEDNLRLEGVSFYHLASNFKKVTQRAKRSLPPITFDFHQPLK